MKWLTIGIFLIVVFTAVKTVPVPFADDDPLRLPKSSFPLRYDLTISTAEDLGQRAFSGVVKIDIMIRQATNTITLHSSKLTIESLTLTSNNDGELASSFVEEAEKDFLHITSSSRRLAVDEELTIEIEYSGLLSLGTSGFYRSSFRAGGNELR